MGAVAVMPAPFVAQMKRLVGLKFAPADMQTHWEALREIPMPVLEAAVSRAQKTRSEFPSPAELREDCDAVAHTVRVVVHEDRGTDLPEPVLVGTLPTGAQILQRREWRYYHDACSDSGTESLWCGETHITLKNGDKREIAKPWQKVQACERTRPHGPHEWVRRCTCFDSNPALIRKREQQRQYAESKGKAK